MTPDNRATLSDADYFKWMKWAVEPAMGAWPDNPQFPAGWDERDAKGT